jgi:hypothetical protein
MEYGFIKNKKIGVFMSENKRFEELSKLNRNDLLDLQNKILKNLEESFNSKGNQILLEEDKNTWT